MNEKFSVRTTMCSQTTRHQWKRCILADCHSELFRVLTKIDVRSFRCVTWFSFNTKLKLTGFHVHFCPFCSISDAERYGIAPRWDNDFIRKPNPAQLPVSGTFGFIRPSLTVLELFAKVWLGRSRGSPSAAKLQTFPSYSRFFTLFLHDVIWRIQ